MKKIIRLTESDLEKIIEKVLIEQSVVGVANYGMTSSSEKKVVLYPCVPDSLRPFIVYLMANLPKIEKQLGLDKANILYLTKYAMSVIGRETQFGTVTDLGDDVSEMVRGLGLGFLPEFLISAQNKIRQISGKSKTTQSLGLAQFTPDTWKQYGLDKSIGDFNSSFNSISQGLGSLYRLAADYKLALKIGLQTGPSVNPILKKYAGTDINGSGNNALDFAIIAHNMGSNKIKKYCKTNHELYAAPCDNSTFEPFKKESGFNDYKKTGNFIKSPSIPENLKKFPGVLKVNQSSPIPNYFPNLKGPNHTAIGYVEAVANNAKKFNCF
jgi:hypothetical protein